MPPLFVTLVRNHVALIAFLLCYAVVYLLAIAFYRPIPGTTGRMILAHMAPLVFALARFLTRPAFSDAPVAGPVRVAHLQPLILGVMLFDVTFRLWP